jgi:hypothetical protein
MTRYTTYPKLDTEDLQILSYGRSKFFTFLFFMIQISRIRPCENNKSCSILHNKSNKICFEIFRIFYEFLRILQVSAQGSSLLKIQFAPKPLEKLNASQIYPWITVSTLERIGTKQFGPWGRRVAGSPEFRRRARAGNDSGSSMCSPRIDWWSRLGQKRRRHESSTAAGGGTRGGAVSGEDAARGGQGAGRGC